MKLVKLIDQHLEEVIIAACMLLLAILIGIQVLMRYVAGDSLYWSEEVVRYTFILMVYIGISDAVKKKAHISIDILTHFSKKNWVSIIPNTIFLAFAATVVYQGTLLSLKLMKFGQTTPALEIPTWIVYSFVPIGYALVCFRLIQITIPVFKDLFKDQSI